MSIRRLAVAFSPVVLVAVFACGGGGGGNSPTQPPPPPPPPPTGDVVVSVREFSFTPKSVQVEPGQTVVWQLEGDLRNHNVIALGGRFSGFLPNAGASFRQTFTEDDRGKTYTYRCSTHQACCLMQGSVRVGANSPPPDAGY